MKAKLIGKNKSIFNIFLSHDYEPPLEHPRRQHIHSESGSKTSKDIYHVVRLDIHRGRAEQQIERHQAPEQFPAAAPRHNHQDGGHAHVRTGESRRRPLAHLLRALHQAVEESLFKVGLGQQLLVVVEVVANRGEHARLHAVETDGREVELRTRHRHEYIEQVIHEKRGYNDERHLLEQVKPPQEVPQHHQQYHRVVEEITHVERLAHPQVRPPLREAHGGLTAKQPLLDGSKHMVKVRKHPVELKRVRIPVGQQRHLHHHPHECRKAARRQPGEGHQQEGGAHNEHAVGQHMPGVVEARV